MLTSLKLLTALFIASFYLSLPCCAETKTVVTKLSGLKSPLPKKITQLVRVIDVTSGELLSTKRGKARLKFKSAQEEQPSIMVVHHVSNKVKLNRGGFAALFESGGDAGALVHSRIRMRASTEALSAKNSEPVMPLAAVSSLRVGVPASGFTVSGPGISSRMSTGIAGLVIVNIAQNSPCYGANSGVVIIEVDPLVQAARETEFQLCSSGLADPSSCVADNYVAPDHSVRGSINTDGSTASMTVEFVDPNGNVIASETETGPAADILELVDKASKRLAMRMCDGRISIVSATCPQSTCLCCNSGPACQGNKWDFRYEISAKGAVGSKATFNLLVEHTQLDCGSWSAGACGAIPCCVRELGQPEETTLSAVEPFPFPNIIPNCFCPPLSASGISFFVQLIDGEEVQEREQIVNCPQ